MPLPLISGLAASLMQDVADVMAPDADAITGGATVPPGATTITIRRGVTTLDPQAVRVVSREQGRPMDRGGVEQAAGWVRVVGATTLDIQAGDTFVVEETRYRVSWVRPDTTVATIADAEALQ